MKKIFILLLISLLLITACQKTEQVTEKEEIISQEDQLPEKEEVQKSIETKSEQVKIIPGDEIIEHESKKEIESAKKEPEHPNKILRDLFKTAPKKYWFFEETDQGKGQIVLDNKRGVGEYNYAFDAIFWDIETKEVYLRTFEISQSWWLNRINQTEKIERTMGAGKYLPSFYKLKLTGDREKDKELLPLELIRKMFETYAYDRIKIMEHFYSKSPVDWMEDYKDEIPIKIETAPQTFMLAKRDFFSNLTIHYKNKKNPKQTIIMRFDKKFNIPLLIDVQEGSQIVRRHKFIFDTRWYEKGKTIEITEKLVTLPEDAIIVTEKDIEYYLNEKET